MSAITELLANGKGDAVAIDQLVPLVYQQLHQIARNSLRSEGPGHTLQPTALVNEAYLRLAAQHESHWQNRAHFFGIAARLMKRVVLDHARRRHAQRRGGSSPKVSLEEAIAVSNDSFSDLVALDDLLDHLARVDERQARIAELHILAGLTMKEVAETIGCDERVAQQEWRMAKAWLHSRLVG